MKKSVHVLSMHVYIQKGINSFLKWFKRERSWICFLKTKAHFAFTANCYYSSLVHTSFLFLSLDVEAIFKTSE